MELPRIDRRESIRWMLAAAASLTVLRRPAWAVSFGPGAGTADDPYGLETGGYGLDPDLLKDYGPGAFWPLTLTPEQRQFTAILADIIIPADEHSPSASQVGVVDFIDEWISAPYRVHKKQRQDFLEGVDWMNQEAIVRFDHDFVGLTPEQRAAICDDICYQPRASDAHLPGARFFAQFRNLTAGGFYTTREGWKDIQYIGNTPMAAFPGPPDSVLKKLGII